MSAASQYIVCPKYDKLVSKKKTKSPIWSHFGLPANENGQIVDSNIAVCKICLNVVSSKGGSTSNMIGHLKLHHPLKYTNMSNGCKRSFPLSSENRDAADSLPCSNAEENVQSTLESLGSNSINKKQKTLEDFQPLDSNSSKFCTEAVAKFLAFTMQPYNLVERKPFIDMVKSLNPRYKLPSRKYFSKTGIPKLYNDTVEKMQQELARVKEEEVSITTDCWTSVANTPYIAVTVHFIDDQWNLRSACLSCAHFEVNHTYTNISDMLTSILSDWNLNIKNIACCTTDNGSNILKAMSYLQLTHISCFGHNINIGINRALGLSQLQRAIRRLKKLQSAISHSWKMRRDLTKAQEFLQMDIMALPSACPTRWWSTLKLIRRFLENQLAISKLLQDYPDKKHLMPEGCDVSALEDFVSTTKLLEDITTTLSGEEYVTASAVLPLYRKLKRSLLLQDGDSALCKEIKSEILSSLAERYEKQEIKSILWMSSLCDPRFRLFFTDSAYEIKTTAIEKMTDIYTSLDESSTSQPGTSGSQMCEKSVKKGLAKLLEFEDTSTIDLDSTLPEKKAETELNNYLAMPRVGLDINQLTWWKLHGNSFPVLKILARKYLAIQGSSVPSERVFSTGGSVITRQRAALLPKNAEMQILLAQNKRYLNV